MKRYITAYILGSALLVSCSNNPTTTNETTAPEEQHTLVSLTQEEMTLAGIETGNIEIKVISNTVLASGMLDVPPTNKVSISAPMQGVVKNTSVLQGTHVIKGEVIAELQHADYIQLQQDYLDFAGQLEYLQAEYKRQGDLAS